MTKTCLSIERLAAYVSAKSHDEGVEGNEVEAHAAGCESCRLTLAAWGLAKEPGTREEEALIGWIASARPIDVLLADLGLIPGGLIPGGLVPGGLVPGGLVPGGLVPGGLVPGGLVPAATRAPVHSTDDRPAATLRALPQTRTVAPRRSATRWVAGAVAAVAAVLLAVLFLPRDRGEAYVLPLGTRASEARPSHEVAYAPFAPIRGEGKDEWPTAFEAEAPILAMREKKREEADRLLTALFLWRGAEGDQARARALLDTRPPTAARENDRGVLLLSAEQPEAALASFDKALKSDPNLQPALFNRAIALEALGRREEAIAAWETYLGRSAKEPDGWVEEARRRLAELER